MTKQSASTKHLLAEMDCIIVHGCASCVASEMNPQTRTYDKHWIPWLASELRARGILTQVPLMPEPWAPEYARYKSTFERLEVNSETMLIGHSCGCSFLVRWLGDTKKKVAKLVLVAPWKIADTGEESKRTFYDFTIDETISARVEEIVMFTSDNEDDVGKRSLQLFRYALKGRIVDLPGRGHYTLEDMGTVEVPELLQAVLP